MKIYFTCSTAEFENHKQDYYKIRDYLVSSKHTLTRDWLKKTQDRIDTGDTEISDIRKIYKGCIEAIHAADIVIIEDTVSNFSTGHQITLALQRKKPTLVLWKGKKHRHFKNMFIHGIESSLIEVRQYRDENLVPTLNRFINKYKHGKSKNRFHLVLNQVERDYLDWAQFNKGKSRTKLIRQSLQDSIENDEDYQKYLETRSIGETK